MPKHAKKSIELLKELKLIEVDRQSRYRQTSKIVNTAPEVQSLAVRNFHKSMCDLAKESIENVSPDKREMSSITGRISGKGFQKIKKRIQDLRDELLQIINDDEQDDRVYQLNFQFFPLSVIDNEDES